MGQWTEITARYDDPQTYGRGESYYGNGRYPPDWKQRRRAVWQQQSDCCGRCGRPREQLTHAGVHHIRSLSEGGSNSLDNLVGLCSDCHSLMHPANDDIDGVYFEAPVFPADNAVPTVATVRKPTAKDDISSAVKTDLTTLERVSSPDANEPALSAHTYAIEAAYARKLPDQLTAILGEHDVIAKSSDYLNIDISVKMGSIRGILSKYTPDITIKSDGALVEPSDWTGRWRTLSCRIRLSEDTTRTTLILSDGTGETEKTISLDSQTTTATFSARPPPLWD